jgi:succinoglycan biosynthesis protein ExoM
LKVAVCITTYKRPDGLCRLLNSLNRQTFLKSPAPEIQVVIVDNDVGRSGYETFKRYERQFAWGLSYVVEPKKGISSARNTAIAQAMGLQADFVAFIDDDEAAEPLWLDELLYVQRTFDADVVAGPVLSHFIERIDGWIAEGGFFDRRRHQTGTLLGSAGNGNVLISRIVLESFDVIYDLRFSLTGGEDTHFFWRVVRKGFKIIWANDAVAYEWVPAERATFGWLARRHYRYGNTISLCDIDLSKSKYVKAVRFLKAIRILGISILLAIINAFTLNKSRLIKPVMQVFFVFGMIAGIFNKTYSEYNRVEVES